MIKRTNGMIKITISNKFRSQDFHTGPAIRIKTFFYIYSERSVGLLTCLLQTKTPSGKTRRLLFIKFRHKVIFYCEYFKRIRIIKIRTFITSLMRSNNSI